MNAKADIKERNNPDKVLTVSVAAYNVESYLAQALETCITSNMDMLEVIIVDDGSSDGTAVIAREYVSRYPNTFKLVSKENGGYGSTLNASLAKASGKYFRLLDGDDWFDSGQLEFFLNLLATSDEDAVFAPYIRHYIADDRDEIVNNLPDVAEGVYDLVDFEFDDEVAAHALTYRTDFLRDIGLRVVEHCFYTDAVYAYVPMAFAKKLRVTSVNLYRYRIGREGQSVSVEGIKSHHDDILKAAKAIFSTVCTEEGDLDERVVCRAYTLRFLSRSVASSFGYICLVPPSKDMKAKLTSFNDFVFHYPAVYEASGKYSRRVWLMRHTHFLLYRLACWQAVRAVKK